MSPLFAWAGAVLSLLVALMSGSLPGVLTHPADGATSFEAASVRQSGAAAAADPPCPVGWTDADTSYARSILASVVSSGTAAWAIGLTTVSEDPRYPLAVRWDGQDWVDMPIEASSAERALFGLDRSPTGRLWAAGYRAKSSLYYPMMMHWNGSTWVVSSLGSLGRRGGALLSVRALSDARHMGRRLQGGHVRTATGGGPACRLGVAGGQPIDREGRDRGAHGHRRPEQHGCLGRWLGRRSRRPASVSCALERPPLDERDAGDVRLRGCPHLGRDRRRR